MDVRRSAGKRMHLRENPAVHRIEGPLRRPSAELTEKLDFVG